MRRASEFYLAIATLGLSEIILEILRRWTDFTGSAGDTTGGIRPIDYSFGFEISQLRVATAIFWVWFVAVALVMLLAICVARRAGATRGRSRDATRASVAATLGVPMLRRRITMFVLGSGDRRGRRRALRAHQGLRQPRRLRHQPRPRHLRDPDPRRHRLALGTGGRRGVLRVRARSGSRAASSGSRASTSPSPCSARSTGSATSATSSSASLLVITMIAFPEGLVGVGPARAIRHVREGAARSGAPG